MNAGGTFGLYHISCKPISFAQKKAVIMENYIQILRHPLISNMRNPLRRELPQDATLEQAIAAAKSYGEEMVIIPIFGRS
jgi:hypothetical protein